MPSFTERVRRLIGMTENTAPAAMADIGMDNVTAFGPGVPMQPYKGFSATPRSHDFPAGYNISARPRRGERVAFSTLRALSESYDVAQLAISHTIDDVRSMTYTLKAAPWFRGDCDDALDRARKIMRRPDGVLPFVSWLAKYLDDVLRFDAGTLYRMRNRRGDVVGLKVIDGTSISPLLDDFGDQPAPPAPAFVQWAQGTVWDWLSADDLIYTPFRPRTNSPYGLAPLEMVLLNANTDLRFQQFFLRRFTEGTVPEGFAGAPAEWTPDQISQFQDAWDDMLYGDEAAKHQVKWVPHGTTFTWPKDQPFDAEQAKWLERKTLVAFGRVPADMGITDDVNRSTGDSQADVQFRVGTLPLVRFVEAVLDDFLQTDLGLPVVGAFDTGQETEDRLATAQADGVYIDHGVVSSDEVREMRFGLPVDNDRPIGRYVFGQRTGPIPAAAVEAVSGPIDPETYGPAAEAPLPTEPFAPVSGVAPEDSKSYVELTPPVAKATTDGVTAATGIEGVDLDQPTDLVPSEDEAVTKAEIAAFRRFVKGRRKAGTWRDFTFTALPAAQARELNREARTEVRKAAGVLVAAGLVVRAADTGRVLMLQRAHTEDGS